MSTFQSGCRGKNLVGCKQGKPAFAWSMALLIVFRDIRDEEKEIEAQRKER